MKHAYKSGFTIVELLIVIAVIAILAAISIVTYTGIQNRSYDTSVQSDLRNFANLLEMYNADRGDYPRSMSDVAWMHNNIGKVSISTNSYEGLFTNTGGGAVVRNFQYCFPSDASNNRFAIIARSKSNKVFVHGGSSTGEYTGLISGTWATNCTNVGVPMSNNQLLFLYANGWHDFNAG